MSRSITNQSITARGTDVYVGKICLIRIQNRCFKNGRCRRNCESHVTSICSNVVLRYGRLYLSIIEPRHIVNVVLEFVTIREQGVENTRSSYEFKFSTCKLQQTNSLMIDEFKTSN